MRYLIMLDVYDIEMDFARKVVNNNCVAHTFKIENS